MSIEFNDINGSCDGHHHRFGCTCSCTDIGHVIAFNFFDDEPEWLRDGLSVEFLYSPSRAWYQRIWDAVKYVFHPIRSIKYDGMDIHPKDVRELHKFIGHYLEKLDEQERQTAEADSNIQ